MSAGRARSAPPRGHQDAGARSSALSIGLPDQVVDEIVERVADLVLERLQSQAEVEAAPFMNSAQAAAYLGCSVKRLHKLTHLKRIPFEKDGSRLLFRRVDLDDWVAKGGATTP